MNLVLTPLIRALALLALLGCCGAAATPVPEDAGPWVVRATFSNQAQLWKATREFATWERRDDVLFLEVPDRYGWQRLQGFGLQLEVDSALSALLTPPPRAIAASGIPGFPCYRSVDETHASAQALALQYPELAQWLPIGASWEWIQFAGTQGDQIHVLRLGHQDGLQRPALFAMAALHARELTTAELLLRFAEQLLQGYGEDPDITWMLDAHEVHLVLQANPDGRRQAETGLLWRKNANQKYCGSNPSRRGADLNRNFPFGWGEPGASSTPCNLTFRGSGPSSEPETVAIRDYLRALFPAARPGDLVTPAPDDTPGLMLDIHSFSRLVLWPWGGHGFTAPNGPQLERLGRRLAWFNDYAPMAAVNLYPTSGTTVDFAYGERGVAAFTFELGNAFFEACEAFENQILPDNLDSLRYALRVTRAPYQLPAGPDIIDLRSASTLLEPGDPLLVLAAADASRYKVSNNSGAPPAARGAWLYLGLPPWEDGAEPLAMQAGSRPGGDPLPLSLNMDSLALTPGRHLVYVQAEGKDLALGPVYASFLDIAPSGSSALLQGLVSSSAGLPLSGAQLSAASSFAETDAAGGYRLRLEPGASTISVTAPGYFTRQIATGALLAGSAQQLDIVLWPACEPQDPSCDRLFSHGFEML